MENRCAENPYAVSTAMGVDPKWKKQLALDIGRFALILIVWLAVTYAVSLPASKLLTKDSTLIATSPFIPIGLLATIIAGQSIWAVLITLFACPVTVGTIAAMLGVRRKRAWAATVSMGVLYGLFLRLFYLLVEIV